MKLIKNGNFETGTFSPWMIAPMFAPNSSVSNINLHTGIFSAIFTTNTPLFFWRYATSYTHNY
jgi:hypothetical protein